MHTVYVFPPDNSSETFLPKTQREQYETDCNNYAVNKKITEIK